MTNATDQAGNVIEELFDVLANEVTNTAALIDLGAQARAWRDQHPLPYRNNRLFASVIDAMIEAGELAVRIRTIEES